MLTFLTSLFSAPASSRRRGARPMLEALEDITLPASTLLYVADVDGASWSASSSWKNIATNAAQAPVAGDSLILDQNATTANGTHGTNRPSTDDLDKVFANFTVGSAFTKDITLNTGLHLTGKASIAGGTFVNGAAPFTGTVYLEGSATDSTIGNTTFDNIYLYVGDSSLHTGVVSFNGPTRFKNASASRRGR